MKLANNDKRVRVKICGITRVEDALAAYNAGADAIGLVFYDKSPRAVNLEQARDIVNSLPPFLTTVGLFVNAEPELITSVLNKLSLDILQFHGDESHEQCIAYDKPYIKAIRMKSVTDLTAEISKYPDTMALLLDSYVEGLEGGTGQRFDWNLIPESLSKPVILAGGLNPDNVREAINIARPAAVDVSGGVEQEKGIKDVARMLAFIQEVNHADNE